MAQYQAFVDQLSFALGDERYIARYEKLVLKGTIQGAEVYILQIPRREKVEPVIVLRKRDGDWCFDQVQFDEISFDPQNPWVKKESSQENIAEAQLRRIFEVLIGKIKWASPFAKAQLVLRVARGDWRDLFYQKLDDGLSLFFGASSTTRSSEVVNEATNGDLIGLVTGALRLPLGMNLLKMVQFAGEEGPFNVADKHFEEISGLISENESRFVTVQPKGLKFEVFVLGQPSQAIDSEGYPGKVKVLQNVGRGRWMIRDVFLSEIEEGSIRSYDYGKDKGIRDGLRAWIVGQVTEVLGGIVVDGHMAEMWNAILEREDLPQLFYRDATLRIGVQGHEAEVVISLQGLLRLYQDKTFPNWIAQTRSGISAGEEDSLTVTVVDETATDTGSEGSGSGEERESGGEG